MKKVVVTRHYPWQSNTVPTRSEQGRPSSHEHAEDTSDEFFDQVRDLVEGRFAEARLERDPHGQLTGLTVTVIDPSERDLSEIDAIASALDLRDWVRVVEAEPADLAAWANLRRDLGLLQRPHSDVLAQYPTLTTTYQRPPVTIYLTPVAKSIAQDLHARYGTFVDLHVGALSYPPTPRAPGQGLTGRPDVGAVTVDPERVRIVLDGPLSIIRGHTVTHAVLLANLGSGVVTSETNGHLTAAIIDASGFIVGGHAGFQRMPLVMFTAQPGQTIRIPLLVGTASYQHGLGYTVPAGSWHLTAPLHLSDDADAVTPPLAFTITE